MRLSYITRSPTACMRCGQPQGANHLLTCPLRQLTVGTDDKRNVL